MLRRWALGSILGGAAWHFGWEIVRAWLYEQGFHVVNPYLFGIQLSWVLHYGVTAVLVGLGLWLFWKTGRRPASAGASAAPRRDKFYRQTAEFRARYIDAPPSTI